MLMTILAAAFGLTMISLIPIGIVVLVRSRHASYSSQDFWGAVKGFVIFNLGLVALFWAMWAMAGGGNMSVHSYWSGSGLLLIAALIIAGAMHALSLPKLSAAAFFIVPMLGYLVDMLNNSANSSLVTAMWWASLVVLPLIITACWVWREARA